MLEPEPSTQQEQPQPHSQRLTITRRSEPEYEQLDETSLKELVEEINYLRKKNSLLEDTIANLKTYTQSLTEGLLKEKASSKEMAKRIDQLEKELEECRTYDKEEAE